MKEDINILFVDDEERIVKLLNMIFRSKYKVHTATSGKEALEIVDREPIDIICSDQRMPGMLGIELLSEVRKKSPDTVRLLLTGYSDLVAIIGAVNEGEVYRFINKPWDQEDLKNIISECVDIILKRREPHEKSLDDEVVKPALANAASILAIDGIATDRHEIVEMFTSDYNVFGASSIDEALQVIEKNEIGVIVTDNIIQGEDVTGLLEKINTLNPFITVVVVSSNADSNSVIRLINKAHVYRVAMKPISPNVFRLAVSAAMQEHHRLLADPRMQGRYGKKEEMEAIEENDTMAKSIIKSLSRFTKIGKIEDKKI